VIYPITKTVNGDPVIGIGGGGFTKKFHFRIVKRKSGDLAPAIFIRKTGDLACSLSQGYVKAEPGDLIIEGSGYLPLEMNNPDISLTGFRVDGINPEYLTGFKVDGITFLDLPYRVIIGSSEYHNRDGSYFSGVQE